MTPERPAEDGALDQGKSLASGGPTSAIEKCRDMCARLFARCADAYPLALPSTSGRRVVGLVLNHNQECLPKPFVYELVTYPKRVGLAGGLIGAIATDEHITKVGTQNGDLAGIYAEWEQRYNRNTGRPVAHSHASSVTIDLDELQLSATIDRLWKRVYEVTPDVDALEIEVASVALDAIFRDDPGAQFLTPPSEAISQDRFFT